jgi:predicted Zn-dependent peptidase
VDHKEVVSFAKEFFGKENNTLGENYKESLQGEFTGGVKSISKKSEQAHVLINFPAPAYADPNRYRAYIANLALGGGMTSVLYQKIREDMGLAYSVYSYLQCFLHEGVMSIYVGTKPDKALDVVGLVIDELQRFQTQGWTQEQLDLYREQLLGEILMGRDDLEDRMSSIGLNELIFEAYRPPEQVVSEIKSIDTKAMNEYFSRYFNEEPNIVTLVP